MAELSSTEKTIFNRIASSYGFEADVVRKAFEANVTVDVGDSGGDYSDFKNIVQLSLDDAFTTMGRGKTWYGLSAGKAFTINVRNNGEVGTLEETKNTLEELLIKSGKIISGAKEDIQSATTLKDVGYQFFREPLLVPLYLASTLLAFYALKKIANSSGGLKLGGTFSPLSNAVKRSATIITQKMLGGGK